jgi:hypothetical protein
VTRPDIHYTCQPLPGVLAALVTNQARSRIVILLDC